MENSKYSSYDQKGVSDLIDKETERKKRKTKVNAQTKKVVYR